MIKADKSKRTFFKQAAVAVGVVAAAGYLKKLLPTKADALRAINDVSEKDVIKQKDAWLQKQWTPMTDNDKKQMLDEIFASHNKYHT